MKVISGNSVKILSDKILNKLSNNAVLCEIGKFRDGEVKIKYNESLRGKDVVIIQSTCNPVNDNLVELLLMITTAKRQGAATVTCVIP